MELKKINRKFVLTTPRNSFGPLSEEELKNVFEKINLIENKDTSALSDLEEN